AGLALTLPTRRAPRTPSPRPPARPQDPAAPGTGTPEGPRPAASLDRRARREPAHRKALAPPHRPLAAHPVVDGPQRAQHTGRQQRERQPDAPSPAQVGQELVHREATADQRE